jgi:hypothetical protein
MLKEEENKSVLELAMKHFVGKTVAFYEHHTTVWENEIKKTDEIKFIAEKLYVEDESENDFMCGKMIVEECVSPDKTFKIVDKRKRLVGKILSIKRNQNHWIAETSTGFSFRFNDKEKLEIETKNSI